jgi:hypothetical protein
MQMQEWGQIRPVIDQVLREQHYSNSGNYHGEQCFLSAYQIAVLVNAQNNALKGELPIGGEGVGPSSFSQQIAQHLSGDINKGDGNGFEMQFFSLAGLDADAFTFNGGMSPSSKEFSMFRLID